MCTFIDRNTAFAILLLTAYLGRSQSQALLTIFEVCVHVCLITVDWEIFAHKIFQWLNFR